MLNDVWRLMTRWLKVAGTVILLFGAAECARVYALLYRYHPTVGRSFAIVAGLAALCALLWWLLASRSTETPPAPNLETAGHKELSAYCRHLIRVLIDTGNNPHLPRGAGRAAAEQVRHIEEVLGAHPLKDDLVRAITQTTRDALPALWAPLKDQLRKEADHQALQTMRALIASPQDSPSSAKGLLGNLVFVSRILQTLCPAKPIRERLCAVADVLRLSAQLEASDLRLKLQENLLLHHGLPRPAALDLAQWLGAGWQVLLIGEAALDRGTAPCAWDSAEAFERLSENMDETAARLRALCVNQVIPAHHPLLRPDPLPEAFNETAYFSSMAHAAKTALEATALYLKGNRVAAQQATGEASHLSTPSFTVSEPAQGRPEGRRNPHHRSRSRPPAFLRVAITFSQRIKYGWLSRRLYK